MNSLFLYYVENKSITGCCRLILYRSGDTYTSTTLPDPISDIALVFPLIILRKFSGVTS